MTHRLLARQLRRLRLDAEQPPPAPDWARLLELVSATYTEADSDRYLLERSLEVSSAEMRELHDTLARRASVDELTGLPNRRALRERLQQLVAARHPGGSPVGVLFIDLDGFKLVNDSLGHEAGDELLVRTARRLRETCRDDDVVARLGGDEFIVAGRFTGPDQAQGLARRITAELEKPLVIKNREVVVGASIGVALSGTDDAVPAPGTDEILQRADLAMYASKRAGRARLTVFDTQMQIDAERKIRLVSQLRGAIADGRLSVRYEPIVRLADRRVSGHEALVRWQPPGSAELRPSDFVPLAEEYRMIADLDAWVLDQACAWAAGTRQRVGVNLSARSLAATDFTRTVSETLERTGLPASALVLELTEATYLTVDPAVTAQLSGLRSLGVSLAMDDFGSGFSALSRLRTAPVQVLKLDESLIENVDRFEESAAIAGAAVSMAHALRHTVVAEGVERRAQAEILRALGCDAAQGPLFTTPEKATVPRVLREVR
ncbi:putative bifunctional diguanylate cyclase/phosphodiesterase [Kineosporia succinea]|uniref:Diguanylate cyclase (GGDEF)-like protein n=1 Tax=Kineosporia succinea TaxID=84632 RepID=A0ABT9PCD0_9ACTN|nr:EAL domain-containing protein [Kineosporia succinea]MDP9830054.1 diguanylate cyclase (GGDEF)-like protein [Kineosporia succinea]